jgi:hypothetical protein
MASQVWFVAGRDGYLPIEILKGDKGMVRGGELYLTGLIVCNMYNGMRQNGSVSFHGAPELLHSYPASLIDPL